MKPPISFYLAASLVCLLSSASAADDRVTKEQLQRMSALYDVRRADWKASAAEPTSPRTNRRQYVLRAGKINWISIHSTEGPSSESEFKKNGELLTGKDLEDKEMFQLKDSQGERMQHDHLKKGYGDIAYHFLVGPSGKIYEGRNLMRTPASYTCYAGPGVWARDAQGHGHNRDGWLINPPPATNRPGSTEGHLTVCLIGNFDNYRPTKAAIDSAARLVASLLIINKLNVDDVLCHREIASTSCPGKHFYEDIRGDQKYPSGKGRFLGSVERIYTGLTRVR